VSNRRIRNFLFAALSAFLLFFPKLMQADALDDAVRDLARRTLSMKTADTITCVDWQNHAAVTDTRSLQLRSLFVSEAGIAQAAPGAGEGNCALKVNVERTPSEIVFIAQTPSSAGVEVFLTEVPRGEAPAAASSGATIHLEKELLFQQGARILDAAERKDSTGDGSSLIVLTLDTVSLYEAQAGGWNLRWSQPIPSGGTLRRDPRGELHFAADNPDALQIFLSGRICEANIGGGGPIRCRSNQNSWREEILPVSCQGAGEELSTDTGDWSHPDRILLINPALPSSQTPIAGVNLPGPVLSLTPGNKENVVSATIFNLAAGNYEVYRITLGCGN
jgi:hypothetical protein